METDEPLLTDAARQLVKNICDEIATKPDDREAILRRLQDLKKSIVDEAAGMAASTELEQLSDKSEFLWSLAAALPDFDCAGLYEKRTAFLSLAGAVGIGWVLGGIVAALLDFIGMGGDIIRAAAILGAIWLNDYLGANPRARRIALTCLGLGALTRFAGQLAAGLVRFGSFSSFRSLVFGAGARPNFFKSVWLLGGAFFLLIFFSKKITGLNMSVFEQNLLEQTTQRLNLALFVIKEVGQRDFELRRLENSQGNSQNSGACANAACQLASGVLDILDSLEPPQRSFLSEKLAAAGFGQENADNEIVWNSERDSGLYIPMGLIADGDRCRILKQPRRLGDKLIKGHAQRIYDQPPAKQYSGPES